MSKHILIDSQFGLVRTAIAQGAHLVDYYEEPPEQGRCKGNIYRGVVKRVDPHIQAAFIRYGQGRDGFLPLRDAESVSAVGGSLRVGEPILVQVVKDEVAEKGAALTAKLSFSGRYLVYIPGKDGDDGISSRINDEERAALKKLMSQLQIPEAASVILRTAAIEKGLTELQADVDRMSEAHRRIQEEFLKEKEPALMFREADPASRYLREYYTPDVEKIWVNESEIFEECRQFFRTYEPESEAKVFLSKDGPQMFQRHGLETEIEKLTARKVHLPSGANIVIDQAEALVAIDVNSAKSHGRGEDRAGRQGRPRDAAAILDDALFAVNKEAAIEIARQLRLRDLGGIIIVDFIDMENDKHRRQIEELMRRALAADKAKVRVFDISPLGIMQISRQRLRKAGAHFSRVNCEACFGRGWHPSAANGAYAALRRIEERLMRQAGPLILSAPYPVANHLVNDFREHILELERRFHGSIRILALPSASGEIVLQGVNGREPDRDLGPKKSEGSREPERQRGKEGRRDNTQARNPVARDQVRRGGPPQRREGAQFGERQTQNENPGAIQPQPTPSASPAEAATSGQHAASETTQQNGPRQEQREGRGRNRRRRGRRGGEREDRNFRPSMPNQAPISGELNSRSEREAEIPRTPEFTPGEVAAQVFKNEGRAVSNFSSEARDSVVNAQSGSATGFPAAGQSDKSVAQSNKNPERSISDVMPTIRPETSDGSLPSSERKRVRADVPSETKTKSPAAPIGPGRRAKSNPSQVEHEIAPRNGRIGKPQAGRSKPIPSPSGPSASAGVKVSRGNASKAKIGVKVKIPVAPGAKPVKAVKSKKEKLPAGKARVRSIAANRGAKD